MKLANNDVRAAMVQHQVHEFVDNTSVAAFFLSTLCTDCLFAFVFCGITRIKNQ